MYRVGSFWQTSWWYNFTDSIYNKNSLIKRHVIDVRLANARALIIDDAEVLQFNTEEDAIAFILKWS